MLAGRGKGSPAGDKVVRGIDAGASEFASLLAETGSATDSRATSGTRGASAGAVASSASAASDTGGAWPISSPT